MTLDRLDTLIGIATIMLGLSIIITIVNQIISSLLGHRATYLKDGIVDLLVTLDPGLKAQAETIAENVLTHKLSSDSIFAHLRLAPKRWKMAKAIKPDELPKLLKLVSSGQDYEAKIDAILEQVNPAVQREARMLAAAAPQAAGAAVDQIKQLADKTTATLGHLEAAFDSTLDRIRQRFTLQMRIWTIIFSVTMAFIFHLDAATLYSRLSTDASLRSSVSGISDTMMKKYQEVQAQSGAGAAAQPAAQTPDGQTAAAPPAAKPTEEELRAQTRKLAADLNEVKQTLASSNLKIFQEQEGWYKPESFQSWGEFFRILATAGLLSLGAPFWFNALKSLTSLRSAAAQKKG